MKTLTTRFSLHSGSTVVRLRARSSSVRGRVLDLRLVLSAILGVLALAAGCSFARLPQEESAAGHLTGLSLREQVALMIAVPLERAVGSGGAGAEDEVWHVVREEGIAGVMVRGSSVASVAPALDTLQAATALPLLVIGDLSRGAGGVLGEATELPPAHLISAWAEPAESYRAGHLAAREARVAGIQLGLVGASRLNGNAPSFLPLSSTPHAADALVEYLRGMREEGLLTGIEAFTVDADTSAGVPRLNWDRARLEALELPVLRRAIAAGIDAVLLAPVALPAITGDTLPLPLSPAAVRGLLRAELGWGGVVMADLSALARENEGEAAVAAAGAGVDLLLNVADVPAAISAILQAVEEGRIPRTRIEAAAHRVVEARIRLRGRERVPVDSLPARLRTPAALAQAEALTAMIRRVQQAHANPPASTLRPARAEEVGMSEAALARVDATIRKAIADSLFPGAALAVGRPGGVVRLRGYGRLSREPHAPEVSAEETLYDIASLTKVVGTTAAVMALVDDGKLELDAPLRRYLPDFVGEGKDSVTVRHLLTHTGGLPAGLPLWGSASPEEALRRVLEARLVLNPGGAALYSDLGMILLAEAAARAAGEPLDRFLARRIFAPLGMSSTMFLPPLALYAQTAPSALTPEREFLLQGTVHDGTSYRLGGISGHAGLFSTARDLAVFAQTLLGGGAYGTTRLFSPETVRTIATRQPNAGGRALGWDTPAPESSAGSYFSARSFGHTGWTGTSIWIDPERDLFVVLLTNRTYDRTSSERMLQIRREIHDGISRAITDLPLVKRPGAIEPITPPALRRPAPAPRRPSPPRSPRARRP